MASRRMEDLDREMWILAEEFFAACKLDPWLTAHGIEAVLTDGRREPHEQFAKFKIGREFRDGKWIIVGKTVTDLIVGAHNVGAAIDVAPRRGGRFLYPDVLQRDLDKAVTSELRDVLRIRIVEGNVALKIMGEIGEGLGLEWGGRYGESTPGAGDGWDRVHHCLPNWKAALAAMPST